MSFLVWVYTSQDFAQTQQNFARSHDRVTVTFRNSARHLAPDTLLFVVVIETPSPSAFQKGIIRLHELQS